jgi:hypothetical protein
MSRKNTKRKENLHNVKTQPALPEMWQVRRALVEVAKRLNARNLMRLYAFARRLEKEK